jgi:hypothetical protein
VTAPARACHQLGLAPAAGPDEIKAVLLKRIAAWRYTENTASRATYRHARPVREYLESLFRSLPPA